MKHILLGDAVVSESPRGSLDKRNLVNILWTGILACAPIFLNSISTQIETLSWGKYGMLLPVVAMLLKTASETLSGKSTN